MKATKSNTPATVFAVIALAIFGSSFTTRASVYGDSTRRSQKVVDLGSLEATSKLESVTVRWTTTFEKNNDYYTIQRSENGQDFYNIGVHKATNHLWKKIDYLIEDWEPVIGRTHYRLLYTVPSGETKVLETVEVLHEGVRPELKPTEIPDMVKSGEIIRVTNFNTLSGTNQVNFIDADGMLVHTYYLAEEEMNVDFDLTIPAKLKNGFYELQFIDEGDLMSYSKPVLIDK